MIYVAAALIGLALPWAIIGRSIRAGFAEGGPVVGFGYWTGVSVLTVPIMLVIAWLIA